MLSSFGQLENFTEGGPPAGVTVMGKRVDVNTYDATSAMDGKQVATSYFVVSHDGKTLTVTQHGADAKGKAFKTVEVYDRQ